MYRIHGILEESSPGLIEFYIYQSSGLITPQLSSQGSEGVEVITVLTPSPSPSGRAGGVLLRALWEVQRAGDGTPGTLPRGLVRPLRENILFKMCIDGCHATCEYFKQLL